jgi:hypothetical protein
LSRFNVEDDNTKIARQSEEDCSANYTDGDGIQYDCILTIGHDGPHVDPTGIEFLGDKKVR